MIVSFDHNRVRFSEFENDIMISRLSPNDRTRRKFCISYLSIIKEEERRTSKYINQKIGDLTEGVSQSVPSVVT